MQCMADSRVAGAAQICTVFAQFTDNTGKAQGPHVFVVRLRDERGRVMPGVRIKDNGPKAGLNGVDNGTPPLLSHCCHVMQSMRWWPAVAAPTLRPSQRWHWKLKLQYLPCSVLCMGHERTTWLADGMMRAAL